MKLTIFKGWRIAWGFLQSSANGESIDQIDHIDQFEKQIKFLRCVFDNWSHTKYVLLSFLNCSIPGFEIHKGLIPVQTLVYHIPPSIDLR